MYHNRPAMHLCIVIDFFMHRLHRLSIYIVREGDGHLITIFNIIIHLLIKYIVLSVFFHI